MVMNDVYSQKCGCCGGRDMKNEVSHSVLFTPELMAKLVLDIYNKEFDVEADINGELYNATVETFRRAIDEGFTPRDEEDLEYIFYQELRNNNDVWAAFRTHRMQNDIASQLLDEDGKLKEFSRFRDDVESIIGTYNNAWLETEYNTAVIRAHQAADWKRFMRDADVLPNLKWMPTTSADPDIVHKQYWSIGLTLPINHRFWKSHRPGDRWNCKCSLEQTDDPATPSNGIPAPKGKPSPGLDNNPADDGKLFSDSHPYYTNAYPGAKDAVAKLLQKD